jgi:hypothetical protein
MASVAARPNKPRKDNNSGPSNANRSVSFLARISSNPQLDRGVLTLLTTPPGAVGDGEVHPEHITLRI